MGQYSIKELEQLSGVKAHTIRIWEQRYGVLCPGRTQTNIRTYNDEELRHLLNVSLLTNHGYKISKVSELSRDQVKNELDKLLIDANIESLPMGDQINGLILAMLELNEVKFNEIFRRAKERMEFEDVVIELFYPFLRKVGIMWGIDQSNPAQEHFVSNLIRRKILTEIDKIPFPANPSKTFVLFLREGELHEIGLMFTDYILRARGYRTYYLGQNVPMRDAVETVELSNATALITFFVKPFGERGQSNYLNELAEKCQKPIFYNSFESEGGKNGSAQYTHFVSDIPSLLEEVEDL